MTITINRKAIYTAKSFIVFNNYYQLISIAK